MTFPIDRRFSVFAFFEVEQYTRKAGNYYKQQGYSGIETKGGVYV